MRSNRVLLTAGVLAAITAAVHTIAGTAEIQAPLLGSALGEPLRLLLYACWHLVTVALLLSAAALLWCARMPGHVGVRPLATFVSILWLLFGMVFVFVALAFSGPGALLVLPQWILLLPVGALGWVGSRNASTSVAKESSGANA